MNGELRFSPVVYRGQLEQDARSFGVPAPTAGEIEAPFLYVEEVRGPAQAGAQGARSRPRTCGCRWTSRSTRPSIDGQSFRFEHLVLRIENRTGKYLAYRIVTDVTDKKKCSSKGDIPHNAIVHRAQPDPAADRVPVTATTAASTSTGSR